MTGCIITAIVVITIALIVFAASCVLAERADAESEERLRAARSPK